MEGFFEITSLKVCLFAGCFPNTDVFERILRVNLFLWLFARDIEEFGEFKMGLRKNGVFLTI